MNKEINQTHYGSGDNVAGDKINDTKDKNLLREIVIGVIVIIAGAFLIGILDSYQIWPFWPK